MTIRHWRIQDIGVLTSSRSVGDKWPRIFYKVSGLGGLDPPLKLDKFESVVPDLVYYPACDYTSFSLHSEKPRT